MAFGIDGKRVAGALIAIPCTAILVWFGNGLNPWWPLMWFAPLPVLVFAAQSSWRTAAATAFTAWLIGCLNMYEYFSRLDIPWLTIYALVALVFTGAVLLFRALLKRGAPWSALVAFPAMWVSFEYLLDRFSSGGTAGSLAYTQLHFLPFLQLASITGPWGMSFVLLLFPAALAIGLHLRSTAPKQTMRIMGAGAGVVAAVLVFGAVRLAQPAPAVQEKVGLIASDAPGNDGVAADGTETARLLGAYATVAQKLAAQGAQIIVLPEKLGVETDADARTTDAIFESLAGKTGATIVAGLVHAEGSLKYNEARVYAPDSVPLSYDKHHLLPPFESNLTPGRTLTFLHEHASDRSDTVGVAICKDMDFAKPSRRYGEAGAGLMLVPAWDFNMDRAWHGHIAVMRGVEDGFSIVRAAKNGYLTVSDDRGRILAETRSDSAPFATLIAEVPDQHDATIYLRFGDWFAWVAMGLLTYALLRRWLPEQSK